MAKRLYPVIELSSTSLPPVHSGFSSIIIRMNIPTWEYKLEQARRAGPKLNLQKIIDSFNELGSMGWEAVAAIVGSRGQVFVLFKRRGPDISHEAAGEVSPEIRTSPGRS
jgi:hypothetical protein